MILKILKKYKWLIPIYISTEILFFILVGNYAICDWLNWICLFEEFLK